MSGMWNPSSQGGGLLNQPAANQTWGQKFVNMSQTPEFMAMAAALLEQGEPSYTHQPSVGAGFARGLQDIGGIHKWKSEQQLEKDKLKQQELLEKSRLAIMQGHLDIDRSDLELKRAAQALKEQQRAEQQALLSSLLSPTGSGATEVEQNADRQRRAAILAQAGYTEEAFKVLTEKDPENIANKPTKTVITQNQQISQAVDNVVPQIKELMEEDIPIQSPNIWGLKKTTSLLAPENQARYEAKVAVITDTLVGALNLPKTNESIHLVGQMIRKQFGESDEAYFKRLNEVISDLERRKENALKVTSAVGEKSSKRTVIGITPDGRRVNVPADKIDEFISKGGKRG